MRYPLIRGAATALLWVAMIEVISSFAVKQMFDYDLAFTPYFFALGLVGLVLLILSRILP